MLLHLKKFNLSIIHENLLATRKNFQDDLGKEKRMELVHETIIEGGKIFEAIRAGFFQALEEKHLSARIKLFKQMA